MNLLGTPAIAIIGESYPLWPGIAPGFTEAMEASPVAASRHVEAIVRPWHDSQHARGAASLALAHPDTLA